MRKEALERAPKHARKGLALMNRESPLSKPGALEAVLDGLEAGSKVSQLAEQHKVTDFAIYKALVRNVPDEWQAIQAAQSLVERQKAKEEIERAADGVQVSRGRELARMSEWTLERTCRRIYGDKLQIEHSVSLETGELLGAAQELLTHLKRRQEKVVTEPDPVAIEHK